MKMSRHRFYSFILLICLVYSLFLHSHNVKIQSQRKEEEVCDPKEKVVYLKTHKCASSSLQNIFLRFGEKRQLNFVLPNTGNYLGDGPNRFSRTQLRNTPWGRQENTTFHILCVHTRLDQQEMKQLMGPQTTFITMLRDPVEVFESSWTFYHSDSRFGMTIDEFALANQTNKRIGGKYGKNQMLWDLGLDNDMMDDETLVRQKILEVDKTFHLVLMAEKFDESMILLKNNLCWDFTDVTNLKLNGRKEQAKKKLSETTRKRLEKILQSDYMLYNHFREKFNQQIVEFGTERMESQLKLLRKANEKISEDCSVEAADNDKIAGQFKWWGQGLVGYRVSNSSSSPDCELMTLPELQFLDRIRSDQKQRFQLENK